MATSHDHDHHDHDHHHGCGHSQAGDACCTSDVASVAVPAQRGGRSFKIRGMDCVEEVSILRKAVGPLVGGSDNLAFDVLNGRMTVADAAHAVPDKAIVKAVAGTGMSAVTWSEATKNGDGSSHRQQQILFTAASGACLLLGMVVHILHAGSLRDALHLLVDHSAAPMPWHEMTAYIAAILLGGCLVFKKALYAARNLRPDINFLMVVAVLGAAVLGEWLEAASVAFLFALSLTLEAWSVGKARRAIAALLDLAPSTVRVLQPDGSEVVTPTQSVGPGVRFIVHGGERIPLDGRVVAGASAVNQAPITGESVPVEKQAGAQVYAATINGDGSLTIDATKAADQTALAGIIRMVEEAHARRAPSEQWVERFARLYTPAVMLLAVLVFLAPPLLFGADWIDWFYRSLVLLVIACPCALVISTPVSVVASLATAARAGALIKGGAYIEMPAHLKVVAMDKTGTITRGEPQVVDLIPLNGHTEAELLARAAALEARSTHPLAKAIIRFAAKLGVSPAAADDVQVLKGRGLTGRFAGEPFWLGSYRYAVERGQGALDIAERVDNWVTDGKTVILIGNARHICGLIAVADTVRPDARDTIARLHAAGIDHIVMLTGDNRVAAEAIAREVGIDELHAELLPEDKLKIVEQLEARYGAVAMVGDGVNDAPAMARASLGIAMGAIGSDAAIETADIALMTDDIARLPWLVSHAKRTLVVIRQNIAFSLGVKAVFLSLTFFGAASLWGAIAADVGASLLVVFNALRLLRPVDLFSASRDQLAHVADHVAAASLTHGH